MALNQLKHQQLVRWSNNTIYTWKHIWQHYIIKCVGDGAFLNEQTSMHKAFKLWFIYSAIIDLTIDEHWTVIMGL